MEASPCNLLAYSCFQLSEFSKIDVLQLQLVNFFPMNFSNQSLKFLACTPSFGEEFYTSALHCVKYHLLFCFTLDTSELHLCYLVFILEDSEQSIPNRLCPDFHNCVSFCCKFQVIAFPDRKGSKILTETIPHC